MTTTPPTGPAWSVRAEYASISSPLCPVIVTLSASIASYIRCLPRVVCSRHHAFTGPRLRYRREVKDFRRDLCRCRRPLSQLTWGDMTCDRHHTCCSVADHRLP